MTERIEGLHIEERPARNFFIFNAMDRHLFVMTPTFTINQHKGIESIVISSIEEPKWDDRGVSTGGSTGVFYTHIQIVFKNSSSMEVSNKTFSEASIEKIAFYFRKHKNALNIEFIDERSN
jgi:hypothetical protein